MIVQRIDAVVIDDVRSRRVRPQRDDEGRRRTEGGNAACTIPAREESYRLRLDSPRRRRSRSRLITDGQTNRYRPRSPRPTRRASSSRRSAGLKESPGRSRANVPGRGQRGDRDVTSVPTAPTPAASWMTGASEGPAIRLSGSLNRRRRRIRDHRHPTSASARSGRTGAAGTTPGARDERSIQRVIIAIMQDKGVLPGPDRLRRRNRHRPDALHRQLTGQRTPGT